MNRPYPATEDIEVLPTQYTIPGMGLLPINAFVIKATEPVLVDTGIGIDSEEFIKELESVINPQDLRWIWLTHDDIDHTGSLQKVLELASNARLVANGITVLRLGTAWQIPMNRVYLLNPGDSINVGDRKLTAVKPPLYDNPGAIGIYDNKSEAFFSVDSFGAILPSITEDVDKVRESDLVQGMIAWTLADDPWIHLFDQDKFNQKLDKIRQMNPKVILSSHLMPARRKTEQFLKILKGTPSLEPWFPPNQAAMEQILRR